MKKTLFLAVALLSIPTMVRAEGCNGCPKAKALYAQVQKYLSQVVGGAVAGVVVKARPTLVPAGSLLGYDIVDNKTLVSLLGAQAVHKLVDGNEGWATVPSVLAFMVGQYVGGQVYGFVTAPAAVTPAAAPVVATVPA